MDLPLAPDPTPISKEGQPDKFDNQWNALEFTEAYNATWVSDGKHWQSMGGVIMMLVGAAVYYQTCLQPTVAQSSTEIEFAIWQI